jgi:hypothetical protein
MQILEILGRYEPCGTLGSGAVGVSLPPAAPSTHAAASHSRSAMVLAGLLALLVVAAVGLWLGRPAPQVTAAAPPHRTVVAAADDRAKPQPAPAAGPALSAELAAIGLGSLRREIEAALANGDCTLVNAALQDSDPVTVTGIAGQQANQSLHPQLASLARADVASAAVRSNFLPGSGSAAADLPRRGVDCNSRDTGPS